VVYDILPLRYPSFFVEGVAASFEKWLRLISAHADGVIYISKTVADDLNDWLIEQRVPRRSPLQIGWFHLGADMPIGDDLELAKEREMLKPALMRPAALIVGALEYRSDRKGYGQALDAFELLWDRGRDLGLILVGRRVSPADVLTERITHHREYGRRLFWFEEPNDRILTLLYRSAAVLLYPSHGEGFGLPLAEAAWHDLPVIARDLPVFREIAGQHICYFEGYGGSDLAAAVEEFLALEAKNALPSSAAMKPLTWAQSAQQLLSMVLDNKWYLTYGPNYINAPPWPH
jgi:glycosyltransferase involved in cell wall biosynthesis